MLEKWKKIYPGYFTSHPELDSLSEELQQQLSNILTYATRLDIFSEKHPNKIGELLSLDSKQIKDLSFLCDFMADYNLLEKISFSCLFNFSYKLSPLRAVLEEFGKDDEEFDDSSAEDIERACAVVLSESFKNNTVLEKVSDFLSTITQLSGVCDALDIFSASRLPYSEENYSKLADLAIVLSEPLSKCIFDARLRTTGDYSVPVTEINRTQALELIASFEKVSEKEDKIKLFFNFWSPYREGGMMSLKQWDDCQVDINELVLDALNELCLKKLKSVSTREDYISAQALVNKLHTKGASRAEFESIKYNVACSIVCIDWYNTDNFDELMDKIWCTASEPQSDLDPADLLSTIPITVTRAMASCGFMADSSGEAMVQPGERAGNEAAKTSHPVAF